MKRAFWVLLFVAAMTTACEPDWATNPKNEGQTFIINKTDSEIAFESYLSNGNLWRQLSISPGDTVYFSYSCWDERIPDWDKMVEAGWDPFLSAVAGRGYDSINDVLYTDNPTIKIIKSPTNILSWTFDENNIEDNSIFNKANWVTEISNDNYHTYYSWFYTVK